MSKYQFFFFANESYSWSGNFEPLTEHESLPFPLNVEISTKIGISLYLILTFVIGCCLRSKILFFTYTQSIKENPINLFIWFDQLNGIFLGLNILYTLSVLHLPFPLIAIIGDEGCNWTDLMGTFYLIGQTVWSCLIAIYRILFIKYPHVFKYGIKESKFVILLSALGHVFIAHTAFTIAYFDKGILYKICTHQSVIEVIIIIKVNNLINSLNFMFEIL